MSVIPFPYKVTDVIYYNIKDDKNVLNIIKKSPHFIARNENTPEKFKKKPEQYLSRMLWYYYVANQIAYSLTYESNPDIFNRSLDFEYDDKITKSQVGALMRSLNYNIMTNDGNYFIADGWVETFLRISKYMSNTYPDETPQEREHLRELGFEQGGEIDIQSWFKMFELPSVNNRKAQQIALFNMKSRSNANANDLSDFIGDYATDSSTNMKYGGDVNILGDSIMPESVMDFARKLKDSKHQNLAVEKKTKKIFEIVDKKDDVLILENPITRQKKSVTKADFSDKYKIYF